MKKPKVGDAVEVHWLDANSRGPWNEAKLHRDGGLARIRTVGMLLKRGKKRIVISQTADKDTKMVADSITIPTSCVKRLRRLK